MHAAEVLLPKAQATFGYFQGFRGVHLRLLGMESYLPTQLRDVSRSATLATAKRYPYGYLVGTYLLGERIVKGKQSSHDRWDGESNKEDEKGRGWGLIRAALATALSLMSDFAATKTRNPYVVFRPIDDAATEAANQTCYIVEYLTALAIACVAARTRCRG